MQESSIFSFTGVNCQEPPIPTKWKPADKKHAEKTLMILIRTEELETNKCLTSMRPRKKTITVELLDSRCL